MPSTAADSRRQSHHIPASMQSQPPSQYSNGQIQQSYPTHNTLNQPINIPERQQMIPIHGTVHYNPQQSLDSVSSDIGSRNNHHNANTNMNATGSYMNVPYDIWLQQQLFDSSQHRSPHSGTLSDSYPTAESQMTNLNPQAKIDTQPNSSYPASTNRKFSLVEKNRNSHLGPPQTYSQIKHGRNSQNTNSVISNYNQHRQPTSFIPRHTNQVQKLHPNHNTKNQSTYQSYTPPPHPRSFTPYLAPIEEQVRRRRSSQGYKPTEKKSSLGTKDRYLSNRTLHAQNGNGSTNYIADNVGSNGRAKIVEFKPYTVNDYKNMKHQDMISRLPQSIDPRDETYEMRKEKASKMQDYANRVRQQLKSNGSTTLPFKKEHQPTQFDRITPYAQPIYNPMPPLQPQQLYTHQYIPTAIPIQSPPQNSQLYQQYYPVSFQSQQMSQVGQGMNGYYPFSNGSYVNMGRGGDEMQVSGFMRS